MPNPVSKTAYYCTGVRMLDARSPDPLLGDTWAEKFMGEEGRAFFEQFRDFTIPNASNVVRPYIMEEFLRAQIAAEPRHRIVLLGAGFDSRAFRLPGGEWIEVDEAPIIERKDAVAPASDAPNPLTRVTIDFAHDTVEGVLAPFATSAPTTIVMEGVLYYLEPEAVAATLGALQRSFPHHALVCDLQSDAFVRKWGGPVIKRIGEFGARWRFHPANPIAHIEQLGYTLKKAVSIPLRAAELGRVSIPAWAIRYVLRSLRDGYQVCVFENERAG